MENQILPMNWYCWWISTISGLDNQAVPFCPLPFDGYSEPMREILSLPVRTLNRWAMEFYKTWYHCWHENWYFSLEFIHVHSCQDIHLSLSLRYIYIYIVFIAYTLCAYLSLNWNWVQWMTETIYCAFLWCLQLESPESDWKIGILLRWEVFKIC